MNEQIYEDGEYCEKCLGVEQLGRWGFPTGLEMVLCQPCWDDKPELLKWFARQFEEALTSNPDEWEKLPDGKWRSKLHPKGEPDAK